MDDVMNIEDINNILEEIKKFSKEKSIIDITPKEINQISEESVRNKKLTQFKAIDFLYVRPLQKLLNYFLNSNNNKVNYSYDLSDLSIVGRIGQIERMLLAYNCSSDYILNFVPKNIEEVRVILNAKIQGFPDDGILDNQTRLMQANAFLVSNRIGLAQYAGQSSNHRM